MSSTATTMVTTIEELIAATHDGSVKTILIQGHLHNVPPIGLQPGQGLCGAAGPQGISAVPSITFTPTHDGVKLTSDNQIENLRLEVSPDKRALYNDTSVDSLGTIEIRSVVTIGRVQILARDKVRSGHVEIDGLAHLHSEICSQTSTSRPT